MRHLGLALARAWHDRLDGRSIALRERWPVGAHQHRPPDIGEPFQERRIIEAWDAHDLGMSQGRERRRDHLGRLHHRRHLAQIPTHQRVVLGIDQPGQTRLDADPALTEFAG
jgi:hypothetical protein